MSHQKIMSSSCILTDGILLQQRSWVQCIAHWPPARSINGGTIPWSLWWSKLIINQVKGEYGVWHEDMIPYHHAAIKLVDSFDGFYISHVSHLLNIKVDILAALMVTLALPANTTYCLTVATHHLFCLKYGLEVSKVHTISTNFEHRDWWFSIINYVLHGILLDDPKEEAFVRWRSTQFYNDAMVKTLYPHSYDRLLLRCLSNLEAREVLKEATMTYVTLINQVQR